MRKLEVQLGLRLLHRNSRQVSLTEAGAQLLAEAAPLLDQLQTALQRVQAQHDEPAGLLRINTSRLAAGLLINPRLDEFLALYPQIQLELFTDDSFADIVRDGFDAGIRLGAFLARDMVFYPWTRANGRRSWPVLRTGSSTECRKRRQTWRGMTASVSAAGQQAPCALDFEVDGQTLEVETHGRLIFSDDHYVTHAACQGYGVAHNRGQHPAGAGRWPSGGCAAKFERPWSGFHIYYPARKLMPPKLRVFIDFFRGPLTATPVQRHEKATCRWPFENRRAYLIKVTPVLD